MEVSRMMKVFHTIVFLVISILLLEVFLKPSVAFLSILVSPRMLTTGYDLAPDVKSSIGEQEEVHRMRLLEGSDNFSECRNIKLAPRGTFPQVMLISYPGSGNTWTRYLLERATGYYTGSRYADQALYDGGFLGELENYTSGTTIVTKSHLLPFEYDRYETAILLIRNPFDALLSEFNRKHGMKKSHVGLAARFKFQGIEWKQFVTTETPKWLYTIQRIFNMALKIKVIFYEDLKRDTFTIIRELIDFLNLPVLEKRMLCLRNPGQNKFQRKRKRTHPNLYTDGMTKRLNYKINAAKEFLGKHGVRKIPSYARNE